MEPERTGQSLLHPPQPSKQKNSPSPKFQQSPVPMVLPKQVREKCSWVPHCPICANDEEHGEEEWDGTKQNQPRMWPQNLQCPQPQKPQHPQQLNIQHSESQNIQQLHSFQHPQPQNKQKSFNVPDSYAKQIKLTTEWEERIECLNIKYKLDYYSSSESD